MTVVSLKNGTQDGAEILKIDLSDGSSLHLKDFYLHGSPVCFDSFYVDKEISPDEEKFLRFADSCFQAERAGKRLIARAEQTEAGLSRKLLSRFHDSACVSAVMAHLIKNDLVNDERYAEHWLRFRLARKSGKVSGPRQLSAALGNRGIGREALKGAFDKVLDEETEYTLLQQFVEKNRIISGAYSLRGQLRYEGFSSPVINRYFEERTD